MRNLLPLWRVWIEVEVIRELFRGLIVRRQSFRWWVDFGRVWIEEGEWMISVLNMIWCILVDSRIKRMNQWKIIENTNTKQIMFFIQVLNFLATFLPFNKSLLLLRILNLHRLSLLLLLYLAPKALLLDSLTEHLRDHRIWWPGNEETISSLAFSDELVLFFFSELSPGAEVDLLLVVTHGLAS